MKAMIIPGNDNTLITSNWYQYVKNGLEKLGLEVIAENMPDPKLARKEIWISFIKKKLCNAEDSILIGHSSGAVAVLKFLEDNKCKLAILVGAYHSHLNNDLEKKSGYFDEPWKWNQIKNNAEKIIIFASKDDPYIPISEPRLIKEKTNAEYHEYKDEGHFGSDVNKKEFPEIVLVAKKAL
ncbi:MAG: alpha/beta hydrolase [Candidatus Aenigmarchaeota archaeon]|nr:alpha/beta hydrolase [Candidatus Aenigmarchaeota archaeon]